MSTVPSPPDYRAALRELERTRAELNALRATRTFRWTRVPRRLYRRLRGTAGRSSEPATNSSLYAQPRVVHDPSACEFYHSIDLPHHGTFEGYWDLRGGIDDYLGHVDLSDKRVLEIGPASGFVTMAMEQRGAEIVSVELPDGYASDLLPAPGLDLGAILPAHNAAMLRLFNSFWLVHDEFHLKSRVYYGAANALPDGVGDFDVTFIGCVLLHSHDPIGTILSCAQRTRETFIVTDVRSVDADGPDRQGDPVAVLYPSVENKDYATWWTFSPEFLVQLLGTLGFTHATVSFHEQHHVTGKYMHPMFTVVASR